MIEVLLLSVSGGLLGLALAWVAVRIGVSFLPETLPRVQSIRLDWQVAAFALGVALLTGLLCGIVPAMAAARTQVNEGLKKGGRTGTAGGGHVRLRSALVVAELAVALVLLTSSGLLLRSFENRRAINLGFHADHTLTAAYSLPREQYATQATIDASHLALRSRLAQLPAVQAVGVTTILPAANLDFQGTFTSEGYVAPKGAGLNLAWIPRVMGSYFEAQGIPMLRGPVEANLPWLTVVGEIGDVKELAGDVPTEAQFFIPSSQARTDAGSFAPPGMLTGNNGSIVIQVNCHLSRLPNLCARSSTPLIRNLH
jgi:hypothetical protein